MELAHPTDLHGKRRWHHASRVLAMLVAALPFACLFALDHTIRGEGWPAWQSGFYLGCLVFLLLCATFWASHFFRGAPRLGLVFAILSAAFAWKLISTDWIVETDYEYMGQAEHRTYTPPTSPLWYPPKPQELEDTATSWRHMEFFYIGGAGGPTEEPYLRVNWTLALTKITLATVSGYILLSVLTQICERLRPTKVTK